jgi:anti-sigma B factor antagonist
MALSIQVEEGRSFTRTLRLAGRLDDQTAGELDTELDKAMATAKTVVFDLAGLEYTTSAGLRSFLRAQKTMKQRGGQALFVNVQPPVKKVFDIAKAANLNTVFKSVRELDAYLDAMQKKAKEEAP